MTGYSLHLGLNVVDPSQYIPAPAPLAGCINDARSMTDLAASQGFNTRTLLDAEATSWALLGALGDLARKATAGDIALITFAGHGGRVTDQNGDEDDSTDETWCLYDRQVLDDELYRMWAQFSPGVRILVVSDSCHSGTVARAVLAIAAREALVRNPLGQELWPVDVTVAPLRPRALPPSMAAADSERRRDLYRSVQELAGNTRSTDIAAQLILLAGCQDSQVASDGDTNGLFTEALLRTWSNGSFSGDYRAFHSRIQMQMPPDQVPNYYTLGNASAQYQAQKPFTVDPPADPGPNPGGGGGQPIPATGTRRTLRQGDSGEDVRYLQQKLSEHGAWLTIDGKFGPATSSAVRSFQASNGLSVDGVVGPQTWAALEGTGGGSTGGSTGGGTSGGWTDPTPQASTRPTLRRGSKGPDVVYLQQRLSAQGYWLTADGSFGPATESAVRSFQRSNGLSADGVVGPMTWAALG